MTTIERWHAGNCTLYAAIREGIHLPETFLTELAEYDRKEARRLARFIDLLVSSEYISPALLRPELPALGVYAMYKQHNQQGLPYSASRLLCTYIADSDRIVNARSPIPSNSKTAYRRSY